MRVQTSLGILIGAALISFATSGTALAQGAPDTRAFIGGLGGGTFGTAETGSILGVRAGARMARGVHIIAEFGRMSDILPSEVKEELDSVASLLEFELGAPVTIEAAAPATYGLVGVRWSPPAGRVSPFVEAGLGAARVTIDLNEVTVGGFDLTALVRDELASEDLETTEVLIAFAGGINAALTSTVSVDVGYRYSRILTDEPAVNSSAIYGAVLVGWR